MNKFYSLEEEKTQDIHFLVRPYHCYFNHIKDGNTGIYNYYTAGFMKTVPSADTLCINIIYLSLSTRIADGTVFRKHTVDKGLIFRWINRKKETHLDYKKRR